MAENKKTVLIDVDKSAIDELNKEVKELNEALEKASLIIEKLAQKKDEIKLQVGITF